MQVTRQKRGERVFQAYDMTQNKTHIYRKTRERDREIRNKQDNKKKRWAVFTRSVNVIEITVLYRLWERRPGLCGQGEGRARPRGRQIVARWPLVIVGLRRRKGRSGRGCHGWAAPTTPAAGSRRSILMRVRVVVCETRAGLVTCSTNCKSQYNQFTGRPPQGWKILNFVPPRAHNPTEKRTSYSTMRSTKWFVRLKPTVLLSRVFLNEYAH